MKLISTQPTAGALNIPVFNTMTNEQAAKAIKHEIRRNKTVLNTEQQTSLDRALNVLSNAPQAIYFEYPENVEDCFVLSYKI